MTYINNFIYFGSVSVMYDEEGIPQVEHELGNIWIG